MDVISSSMCFFHAVCVLHIVSTDNVHSEEIFGYIQAGRSLGIYKLKSLTTKSKLLADKYQMIYVSTILLVDLSCSIEWFLLKILHHKSNKDVYVNPIASFFADKEFNFRIVLCDCKL